MSVVEASLWAGEALQLEHRGYVIPPARVVGDEPWPERGPRVNVAVGGGAEEVLTEERPVLEGKVTLTELLALPPAHRQGLVVGQAGVAVIHHALGVGRAGGIAVIHHVPGVGRNVGESEPRPPGNPGILELPAAPHERLVGVAGEEARLDPVDFTGPAAGSWTQARQASL